MSIEQKDLDDATRAIKSCCATLRNSGVPDEAIFHALMAGAIAGAVRMRGVDQGFKMLDDVLIMTRGMVDG